MICRPIKLPNGRYQIRIFLVLLIGLFCFDTITFSQLPSREIIFQTGLTERTQFSRTNGEQSVTSQPQLHILAGYGYRKPIDKNWSWQTGIQIGYTRAAVSTCVDLYALNPAYGDRVEKLTNKQNILSLEIPLSLMVETDRVKEAGAYFQMGASLSFNLAANAPIESHFYDKENGELIKVFETDPDKQKLVWPSTRVSAGFRKYGNQSWRLGAYAKLPLSKVVVGNYATELPATGISTGVFSNRLFGFGIEAIYSFKRNSEPRIRNNQSSVRAMESGSNEIKNTRAILLTAGSLYSFAAKTRVTAGRKEWDANACFGFGVQAKLSLPLTRSVSILTGIGAVLPGRNFSIEKSKTEFSPPLQQSISLTGRATQVNDLVFVLPLALEKRFSNRPASYYSVSSGLQLNYSTAPDLEFQDIQEPDIQGNNRKIAEQILYPNNDAQPWISVNIDFGRTWKLKNNRLMRFFIQYNASFSEVIGGEYIVYNQGGISSRGTYAHNGSYLFAGLSYYFTRPVK